MSILRRISARRFTAIAASVILGTVMVIAGCSDKKPNGSNQGPQFDPQDVTIVIGDTIRFTAVSGDHTVTSGTGSSDPNVGQLFDHDLAQGASVTQVFDTPGLINYFCRPHEADGMTGTVTVAAISPKTVDVFASGAAFNPKNIQISVGDAVRWTSSGGHTITSGTGSTDPAVGDLFDRVLNNGQVFTYTFTQVGTFDYFCRVHESSGMDGTVTVVQPTPKTVVVEATI